MLSKEIPTTWRLLSSVDRDSLKSRKLVRDHLGFSNKKSVGESRYKSSLSYSAQLQIGDRPRTVSTVRRESTVGVSVDSIFLSFADLLCA